MTADKNREMPSPMEGRQELQKAATELQATIDAFSGDDADRAKIIETAEKIITAIKDPSSQWVERFRQFGLIATTHLFQVWGAFDQIPEDESISFVDLAAKLDAEVSLVGAHRLVARTERIAGVLVSLGVLKFVGTNSVAHTPRPRVPAKGNPFGVTHQLVWDSAMVPYFHMASYFGKYGRRGPQTQNHIPVTFAYGQPDKTFWEVCAADPAYLQRFFIGMSLIERQFPAVGVYNFGWVAEKAVQQPDRIAVVDVGGGKGHALLAIQQENPDIPLERCVLQDRPEVIKTAIETGGEAMERVQKVEIDFHAGQPIKGALHQEMFA